MKVLTPGYKYELENFENPEAFNQTIQFIEKVEQGAFDEEPYLVTINDGTTNEDLIEVLIDRIQFLNKILPSSYNESALNGLKEVLKALNERTALRAAQGVEGTNKA